MTAPLGSSIFDVQVRVLLPAPAKTPSVWRFYVNSWGRDKEKIIASRVGVKAPARFSCTAEEDSVSEITEVAHTEADLF